MSKTEWKAGTMLYPLPVVLVSCGADDSEFNLFTVSWTGTICSNPPMCYISVRPERHSYGIIKKNMAFVINLINKDLVFATDWCGVKSGREFNKFQETKLTPVMSKNVAAPYVNESPLSIECEVTQIIPLGSHDMFIAKVVAVQSDNKYLDIETNEFSLEKAGLVSYTHGAYYQQGKNLGRFGYSVMKKRTIKKMNRAKNLGK